MRVTFTPSRSHSCVCHHQARWPARPGPCAFLALSSSLRPHTSSPALGCDPEPQPPACSHGDVGSASGLGVEGHNQLATDPRSATLTRGSHKFPLLAVLKYNWYLINYPYLKRTVESVLKNVYIHDTMSTIKMTNVSSAVPGPPAQAGVLSVAGTHLHFGVFHGQGRAARTGF